MAAAFIIDVNDLGETFGVQTTAFGQFEVPPNSSFLASYNILALRPDGATKGWTLQALFKKGTGAVLLMQNTTPAQFANAADQTALASLGVAPFSNGTFAGVSCTGQAGQTIFWSVQISGRIIVL